MWEVTGELDGGDMEVDDEDCGRGNDGGFDDGDLVTLMRAAYFDEQNVS